MKDFSVSGSPSDLQETITNAKELGQHMIIETGLNLPDEFELDDPTIKKLDPKKK